MRTRVVVPIAAVLVMVGVAVYAITTFDGGDEVVDFGVPPPQAGAALPGDAGLDIDDVDVAEELPPRDVVFEEADWQQVAGWIARENADGRAVVVNLWASWCGPCEREIPLLNQAAADHPDVAFLGVASHDAYEDAREGHAQFGIEFPAVRDADWDQIAFQLGARGLPTTVTFDTDGRMVGRVLSELTPTNLAELLGTVQ
ncbi:TlpA family protein disulfide reductase [Egicoccus sp. AB-alg6-2]|uniref:TlpA family protein disulfide reductase n=1 Tax=Egicoccus sp. AB-alg6-2 TaxID=3242692 RepID=UPI00359DD791